MTRGEGIQPGFHEIRFARPSLQRELNVVTVGSIEILQDENHRALHNVDYWNRLRNRGILTAVERCGDSRSFTLPTESATVMSLGTGGSKDPFSFLFNSRAVGQVVVLTHFADDRDHFQPGSAPEGCGAAGAKKSGMKEEKGLGRFIGDQLQYHDVGLQAIVSAGAIAMQTSKPVLAATQDHLTGRIYPLALYRDGGRDLYTEKPNLRRMFERQAHLQEIEEYLYSDGKIPALDPEKLESLAPRVAMFLERHDVYAEQLREGYTDYSSTMQDQNPAALSISTDIRPIELKFPETFSNPGSVFNLRIPRTKSNGVVDVDFEHFSEVTDQAVYPIKRFANIHTVFVETGDIAVSEALANKLLVLPWMQEWMGKDQNRIVVMGSQAGRVNTIREFNGRS